MFRLQVAKAHLSDDDFDAGFASVTNIEEWMKFLNRIRPSSDPEQKIPKRLQRSIAYRIQLMEFECGLLLLDYEVKQGSRGKLSTLHESVTRMKIYQFALTAAAVLEAIAEHFIRVRKSLKTHDFEYTSKTNVAQWIMVLMDEKFGGLNRNPHALEIAAVPVQELVNWREKLSMNQFKVSDPVHLDQVTYENCFIPSYKTFNNSMNRFSSMWPETCLNENRRDFGMRTSRIMR